MKKNTNERIYTKKKVGYTILVFSIFGLLVGFLLGYDCGNKIHEKLNKLNIEKYMERSLTSCVSNHYGGVSNHYGDCKIYACKASVYEVWDKSDEWMSMLRKYNKCIIKLYNQDK